MFVCRLRELLVYKGLARVNVARVCVCVVCAVRARVLSPGVSKTGICCTQRTGWGATLCPIAPRVRVTSEWQEAH